MTCGMSQECRSNCHLKAFHRACNPFATISLCAGKLSMILHNSYWQTHSIVCPCYPHSNTDRITAAQHCRQLYRIICLLRILAELQYDCSSRLVTMSWSCLSAHATGMIALHNFAPEGRYTRGHWQCDCSWRNIIIIWFVSWWNIIIIWFVSYTSVTCLYIHPWSEVCATIQLPQP